MVKFLCPFASLWCKHRWSKHPILHLYKVYSDVTLSIWIVSLVPFPLVNPNCYLPIVSTVFFSVLHLSIFTTVCASCVMGLVVWRSLHFVPFGFFCRAAILTSVKSLGYCPVSYTLLIRCAISLRSPSPSNWVHPQVHHHHIAYI
jgi:hypothetical protein